MENNEEEVEDCNTDPCPIDCEGSWGEFSPCNATCGGGQKTKTYSISRNAAHGGEVCQGENGETLTHGATVTEDCNTTACPVNCIGSWTPWSDCSECEGPEGGTRSRTFRITTPMQHNGLNCTNDNGEVLNDGDREEENCINPPGSTAPGCKECAGGFVYPNCNIGGRPYLSQCTNRFVRDTVNSETGYLQCKLNSRGTACNQWNINRHPFPDKIPCVAPVNSSGKPPCKTDNSYNVGPPPHGINATAAGSDGEGRCDCAEGQAEHVWNPSTGSCAGSRCWRCLTDTNAASRRTGTVAQWNSRLPFNV